MAVLVSGIPLASAKTNPKNYPDKAKVLSFQEQPCMAGKVLRACHVLTFVVGNQKLIASCVHCEPLTPGETYPAKLAQHESVLYVIHQKGNNKWGQDNYSIIDISLTSTESKKP